MGKLKLYFYFLILLSGKAFSQTSISLKEHDFGPVYASSERYVDVVLSTKGAGKNYLLRIKKPAEISSLVQGSLITLDSSITIRLKVNPKQKGRFSYLVDIFSSDQMTPFTVALKGEMMEQPSGDLSSFQACPAFGAKAQITDFKMKIVVINSETREPVEKASVYLVQNGKARKPFRTDEKGQINESIPLGYTYFFASKEGYQSTEKGTYVNFQRNELILELIPEIKEPVSLEIDSSSLIVAEKQEEEANTEEIVIEQSIDSIVVSEKPLEEIIKEEPIEVPSSLSSLSTTDFSDQYFKPVNVTFVLDISSSMRTGDKMELLKYSLLALNQQLRKQDKVSIVTYADLAQVLLPTVPGGEKDKMEKAVSSLEAKGMTAGGAGIKMGYQLNLESYLAAGVNHVVIITDGAFNRNSADFKRYIRKYKKQGISLSVVGILNTTKDREEMQNVAELGGGRYIPIMKLSDAQNNLFQEIRMLTYRY